MPDIKTVAEFEKAKMHKPEPVEKTPVTNVHHERMLEHVDKFKTLGISRDILRAIADEGFTEPTEIQTKSIPHVIANKDVIARAATGSGKTLAFGCGVIQKTIKGRGIQALILAPTRELAEQTGLELKKFSKYKPLRVAIVYGGVPINRQIHAIRTADVIVGTPGRLLDHMQRKTITFQYINTLVLDEADRMLDMGFLPDVKEIINSCSKDRQTLLFSATVSGAVAAIAKDYMKDPEEVFAESHVDPTKLKQIYYDVSKNLKFSLLLYLLKNEKSDLVMVFCNTRRGVDFVAKNLTDHKIDAIPIHGGFAQAKRKKTLGKFHSQKAEVLVCTDVAARGLDIPSVSHVYNYDIPKESDQYIHRIGRTARAGKDGKVINILSDADYDNFRKVMAKKHGTITRTEKPHIPMVSVSQPERRVYNRGRSGKPQNKQHSGKRKKYNNNSGKKRPMQRRQ